MRVACRRTLAVFSLSVCAFFAALAPTDSAGQSAGRLVRTQAEYTLAVRALRPGDTVVLANGVWRDFEILFEAQGSANAPITLTAETPGGVILSGRSNLRLAGEHLVVRGLVFRDGHSPSGEVIAFRRDSRRLAFHSRVTDVVIDGFNKPERSQTETWVALFGRHNRFDHNHLEGKLTTGVTMAVRLDAIESNENHHSIDHNYFGRRPPLGSNGGETLRIGTSHNSLEDSNTLVENNMFEECDGEIEIVSNKSGGNIFRGNVFLRSQGSLALRHGNGNLVENNIFLGGGAPNTGGVRVINAGQTVRNNMFVGLRGENFAGALVVMNGVPNSPINRYHQVRNAVIENNTFANVSAIEFGAGADEERSLAPAESVFRNNLIVSDRSNLFRLRSPLDGISFSGNVLSGAAAPAQGFEIREITPPRPGDGLLLENLPEGVGAPLDLAMISREAVGTTWYPKPSTHGGVRESRVIAVAPGIDTLSAAVESAPPGAVLTLAAGEFLQLRTIEVTAPITIRAATARAATIAFEPSTLFALSGRSDLTLEGVRIVGTRAPDAVGNTVIRARAPDPPYNYALTIADSEFADLNVNRGFAVLRAERGSFAARINISRSRFENVSGPVLSLRGETEAFGVYNAEEIQISESQFVRVSAPAFDIFRGGRDESTFGPRLNMRDSVFRDVGAGGPSALLHGVQLIELAGNVFERAAPMRAIVEVGSPRFLVGGEQVLASGAGLEIVDNR